MLCAQAKLILPFVTSREGAYTGESRGIITMIGELINKITLKGKVKRDFIERRAVTRISVRNTYMYLFSFVQVRNKIQKMSLKTCVEHAMKVGRVCLV